MIQCLTVFPAFWCGQQVQASGRVNIHSIYLRSATCLYMYIITLFSHNLQASEPPKNVDTDISVDIVSHSDKTVSFILRNYMYMPCIYTVHFIEQGLRCMPKKRVLPWTWSTHLVLWIAQIHVCVYVCACILVHEHRDYVVHRSQSDTVSAVHAYLCTKHMDYVVYHSQCNALSTMHS